MPPQGTHDDIKPLVFREGKPSWRARRRPDPTSLANARSPTMPDAGAGMRLWILSDLGVGRDVAPFVLDGPLPGFDAMLIAGDVAAGMPATLEWIAATLRGRHGDRPVILVPGPREHETGLGPSETMRQARETARRLGIVVLSDETVRLPDGRGGAVLVIGATLWTDWALEGLFQARLARAYARNGRSAGPGLVTDDGRPWMPHDTAGSHARSRAFIEDALAGIACRRLGVGHGRAPLVDAVGADDRVVVLTHHAPSPFSLPADWEGWFCGPCQAASHASDLEDVMRDWGAPSLWVHGRVPSPVDYRLGRTRVVANPRHRGHGFDPALVVEV